MAGSYVYQSGVTNIKGVGDFELGKTYSQFDIVFFSGYTAAGTPTNALSLGATTGHYYYTGASSITATTSNSPDQSDSDWTQKLFSKASYGSSVKFQNQAYSATFGDGYYSVTSKSENSLKVTFDTRFEKKRDKESKAIIHLFEDSFNKGDKPSGGYTGIYWTPFTPYNQEHEFYIEEFERSFQYPDVNSVSTTFYREDQSTIDWQGYYIPFNQTNGFYQEGNTYSKHDIVYVSGAGNTQYTVNQSGWYYYTGDNETVADANNSPLANSSTTMWTKNTFYFAINKGVSINEAPRFLKQTTQGYYFIRSKDGLNKALLNLKINFEGRTDKEAKAIIHFLEHKKGVNQFYFSPPPPYDKDDLVFFAPQWSHTLNFKDNNSIEINFIQQPINLLDKQVRFLTLVTMDPYFTV